MLHRPVLNTPELGTSLGSKGDISGAGVQMLALGMRLSHRSMVQPQEHDLALGTGPGMEVSAVGAAVLPATHTSLLSQILHSLEQELSKSERT